MQTRTIKRIFTNMDGALLNSKGQVSERNARRIRRADIPITLVSARAPMGCVRLLNCWVCKVRKWALMVV